MAKAGVKLKECCLFLSQTPVGWHARSTALRSLGLYEDAMHVDVLQVTRVVVLLILDLLHLEHAVVMQLREEVPGLRTNGVNTNGAAAKVMNFDRLGKKVRPGTFGKIKVG